MATSLPPLALIPDDLIDVAFPAPQYTSDLTSTIGNIGTNTDGMDDILNAMTAATAGTQPGIDSLEADLPALGAAQTDVGTVWESDFASSLGTALAGGQGPIDTLTADLNPIGEPGTISGTGTGSGGSTASGQGNCSTRTNQYGLSKLGAFTGVTCYVKSSFQVLRVQDGPCVYSGNVPPGPGATSFPKITSFKLGSGDASVFSLSWHTTKATDGTIIYWYDIQITPKLLPAPPITHLPVKAEAAPIAPAPTQNPSHFDGVGILVLTNPNETLNICFSVDCIP